MVVASRLMRRMLRRWERLVVVLAVVGCGGYLVVWQ